MWPDRVLNPGPLAHESDALPTALCGPASAARTILYLLDTFSLLLRLLSLLILRLYALSLLIYLRCLAILK